jgi:transposase
MRIEHIPGDKLYLDFTGDKLAIVDPVTGEVTNMEVYVATLGHSQKSYVEAIPSQKKEDFIAATENALHYFGGVPPINDSCNQTSLFRSLGEIQKQTLIREKI